MPIYEYRCEAADITLEVSHSMRDSVSTWGDLCERTGYAPGETPLTELVEKVISMPLAPGSSSGPELPPGPCGAQCGCF